jgi:hypothetical protein
MKDFAIKLFFGNIKKFINLLYDGEMGWITNRGFKFWRVHACYFTINHYYSESISNFYKGYNDTTTCLW